jgi:hypothetical protein
VRQSRPWTRNPASHGRRSRREPSQRALTLLLIAFGAGIGFSSISPWSDTGVSASTFEVGTGIYLVIVGVMWSAVGGHLAGRLRTKWTGIHRNEVFFRDTAHGLLAWSFATLLSATILTASTAYLAKGAAAGAGALGQAARSINPRNSTSISCSGLRQARPPPYPRQRRIRPAPVQIKRAMKSCGYGPRFAKNQDLDPSDKAYVAQVVGARTSLSQADAHKRVDDVITETKPRSTRHGEALRNFPSG